MGLGAITNTLEGARAMYAPRITAWSAPTADQASGIPDDDSALAVIRNLYRAEIFGIERGGIDGSDPTFREKIQSFAESFGKSLSAYKKLAEQVSSGRFSPDTLREVIQNADGTPGMYFWAGILEERDAASILSGSARSGALETDEMDAPRALAWLRDRVRSVLLSKQNIEAERVLFLLRAMINPEAAKSRDR